MSAQILTTGLKLLGADITPAEEIKIPMGFVQRFLSFGLAGLPNV